MMTKTNLLRLGAGVLIALSLGGCFYPPYHGYHGGYYGHPAYGYWH